MAPVAGIGLASIGAASAAGGAAKAGLSINPIGLAIGVAATGLSFLLSRDNLRGPDLQELDISGVSEGDPIYRTYGLTSRVPGQIIWADGFEADETPHAKTANTYQYKVSVAVAFCFGPRTISKIFANGKKIYELNTSASVTNDITIAATTSANRFKLTAPGVDWQDEGFQIGQDADLSGFPTPANNGTVYVAYVDDDEIRVDTYVGSPSLVPETGTGATVFQDLPDIPARFADGIKTYPGDLAQMPDTLIEQFLPAGETPAYRSICYGVINDLCLCEFGNKLPVFEAEIVSGQTTVAAALTEILQDAGMQPSQFDVSALTDSLDGYWIRGGQTTKDAIVSLQEAFAFYWQEADGKLVFKKRGNDTEILIPESAFAATQVDGETDRPWRDIPGDPDSLPSEVVTKFREAAEDEQVSSQSCRRYGFARENLRTVDLSTMVMTASKAQDICRNVMWSTVINERTFAFQLPLSQWPLIEGDYCRAFDKTFRISQIARGANGLHEVEAYQEQRHSWLHSNSPAQPSPGKKPNENATGGIEFATFDIAAFRPPETEVRGFYIVPCFTDPSITWLGAIAYVEPNANPTVNSPTYETQYQGILGEATTVLPAGPIGIVDQVNTVTVEMYHGQLVSVSDEEFYEGANACALGPEILLFRDVQQVGTRLYELSHLIRGWRNTESEVGNHAAGDRFALLAQVGQIFVPVASTQNLHIAMTPPNADLSVAPVQVVNISGNTVRRFSPWITNAEWLPNGAVQIDWYTRDRNFWEVFTPDPAPGVNPGIVRVELLSGPGGTTLTWLNVLQATTFYFSPGAVTAFGYNPGDPITFRLKQVAGPNELDSRWEEVTIS